MQLTVPRAWRGQAGQWAGGWAGSEQRTGKVVGRWPKRLWVAASWSCTHRLCPGHQTETQVRWCLPLVAGVLPLIPAKFTHLSALLALTHYQGFTQSCPPLPKPTKPKVALKQDLSLPSKSKQSSLCRDRETQATDYNAPLNFFTVDFQSRTHIFNCLERPSYISSWRQFPLSCYASHNSRRIAQRCFLQQQKEVPSWPAHKIISAFLASPCWAGEDCRAEPCQGAVPQKEERHPHPWHSQLVSGTGWETPVFPNRKLGPFGLLKPWKKSGTRQSLFQENSASNVVWEQ